MVDGFGGQQVSAEQELCDEDVLEDIPSATGPRMFGSERHDVAGLVPGAAALPVAVLVSTFTATR